MIPTYSRGKSKFPAGLQPALVSKGETLITPQGDVERIKGTPNFKDNVMTQDPAFVFSNHINPLTGNRFSDDGANLPYKVDPKKNDWVVGPTNEKKNKTNAMYAANLLAV